MIYMKKMIIFAIIIMNIIGCSLLDEVNREDAERGRTCYETRSGYVYCKDTK